MFNTEYGTKLTKTEKELLKYVVLPPREIARITNRSYSTIKSHLNNIYSRLGVHNSAQLIVKALKKRLIKLEDIEGVN